MTQYIKSDNRFQLIEKRLTIPADLDTPVGIYLKIRDLYPCSVLLESSDYHTMHGSISMIGIDPIGTFKVCEGKITKVYPDGTTTETEIKDGTDVMLELKHYVESYDVKKVDETTSANGLFGMCSYDAVRFFEPAVHIQSREKDLTDIPDIIYVLFRFVIEVNHYKNQMTIVENLIRGQKPAIESLLSNIHCSNLAQYSFEPIGDSISTLTDEQYMNIVKAAINHCQRGDVFQVVLSRRFERNFKGDEFNVYRALRCINPSPYLFYFDMGSFKIFGSSPETHLRVENGNAYIDPIAGTFRRTGDDMHDRELAQALLEDTKENAEHIMLVDLARNDLARSSGEVSIEFLKQIQYYSHVIHMVSRVSAKLPKGSDIFRLFANTFPAGTLSGAPKVRAMQIIDSLEPHARSTYAGCIGMIGFDGTLNQAITIRSFLSHNGKLYSQAGAGIVAASRPESELMEVHGKLGALTRAMDYAKMFSK